MFAAMAELGGSEPLPAASWRCSICDYVHEGTSPPGTCPVCAASADLFEPSESLAQSVSDIDARRILIVGAGVAGLTAAEQARQAAPRAEIVLVTREDAMPYYRLNLTRMLAQEVDSSSLAMKPPTWFEAERIALVHGEVIELNLERKFALLRDNRTLEFDELVLATGAHAFVPPIPGANKDGVHVLRTLEDARQIEAELRPGSKAICIGGGLLGLETAYGLARRGFEVTVLEGFASLLPRQLPLPAGVLLQRHVEERGIHVMCGAKVKELCGDERVGSVRLESGHELVADLVILSAGVRPNSHLARRAGLEVGNGIVVDDHLRTSHPSVLAAGDVAEYRGAVHGIWPTAFSQGQVAGRNAAGAAVRYEATPPSNRLKVADVELLSIGLVSPSDGSYHIYDQQTQGSFLRLVSRDGRLYGAALLGDLGLAGLIKDAIESKGQLPALTELLHRLPGWQAALGLEEPKQPSALEKGELSMASIKGTNTEKNLLKAFAGESQARNRYTYAASVADKAGFKQVAAIFRETAANEQEHAKVFFKFLEGGPVEITATYPAGIIGDTAQNLLAAAMGEHEEWTELYPAFGKIAKEEGFPAVAAAFEMISRVEKAHEERYRTLLERVASGNVWSRNEDVPWKCDNCGYIHTGKQPPEKCPACAHDTTYFQVNAQNY
jgi:nitrite reductase (NADH) large subunit